LVRFHVKYDPHILQALGKFVQTLCAVKLPY